MTEPAALDRSAVLLRFLVGRRGLNAADQRVMGGEAAKHSDVEFIDASDFGDRGGEGARG